MPQMANDDQSRFVCGWIETIESIVGLRKLEQFHIRKRIDDELMYWLLLIGLLISKVDWLVENMNIHDKRFMLYLKGR